MNIINKIYLKIYNLKIYLKKPQKGKLKSKFIAVTSLLFSIAIVFILFFFREAINSYPKIGYTGLFLACFAANATVFLPAPSSAIVTGFALIFSPLLTGIVGGLGAGCGELIGYLAGLGGGELLLTENYLNKVRNTFNKHGSKAVFIFALLPLPLFDIVGFHAGAVKMNVVKFSLLCVSGKVIKMILYAFLGTWLYSFLKSFGLFSTVVP
jgi:membrane protein DedA with SNARE-associated domain